MLDLKRNWGIKMTLSEIRRELNDVLQRIEQTSQMMNDSVNEVLLENRKTKQVLQKMLEEITLAEQADCV